MKLLHPYTPYITEKLWATFRRENEELLISSQWPIANNEYIDDNAESEMQIIMDTISTIRNVRSNLNVAPSKTAPLFVRGESTKTSVLESHFGYLERLVKVENLTIGISAEKK